MVERLKRHPRRHAAVTDQRDRVAVLPAVLFRPSDAQRRRHGGARVSGAKVIVFGFVAA